MPLGSQEATASSLSLCKAMLPPLMSTISQEIHELSGRKRVFNDLSNAAKDRLLSATMDNPTMLSLFFCLRLPVVPALPFQPISSKLAHNTLLTTSVFSLHTIMSDLKWQWSILFIS
jgi:hypothetical protein